MPPTKKLKRPVPCGMCPKMTSQPKRKPRKKPSPYKAPVMVKRYYKGLNDGMFLLRDDLLEHIEDEEIKQIIKERTWRLTAAQSKKLTEMEKQKTKEKIKKWEEEEWMSL